MRQNGTVKFFNQSKGFGFITPDQGGKDVFVHITAVERSGIGPLDEGMRVSFETEPDLGKGPKAVNCKWRNRFIPALRHLPATAGRDR
jgi:CspA family cold shock protein